MGAKSKPKVFAVTNFGYEGVSVYEVFAVESDAEAAIKLAKDYCAAHPRPEGPSVIEDTSENDALHAKWWRALQRWEKKHPFGSALAYYGGDFHVWTLPFNAAATGAK